MSTSPDAPRTVDYGSSPLFAPENPSVWKRYSANHEFPLSIAMSVMLHICVAVLVALVGVWLFNFGSGETLIPIAAVSYGEDPGGGGQGDGTGDPDADRKLQDRLKINDDALPPPAATPEIKFDPTMLFMPNENSRLVEMDKDITQGIKRSGNVGEIGKNGPGGGGGEGDGFGLGKGSGTTGGERKRSPRTERPNRWEIILPMSDSAQFAKKLGEIQAIVMTPNGPGHYFLFDMTKKNPEGKPATLVDINKMNRIWYTNRMDVVCQGLADELGLAARPDFFAIFIPQELENEMLKKELGYRSLSEAEVVKRKLITRFDISRTGNAWNVRVRSQEADSR